MQQLW